MHASLESIVQLVAELLPDSGRERGEVGPDASFDGELGLDSLTRMELIRRVEARYGITLPEERLGDLSSARELWRAVDQAQRGVPGLAARVEHTESGILGRPASARTLVEMLRWHAVRHRDRRFLTMYQDQGEGATLSFGELFERAAGFAAGLQACGLEPRERVALMLPTSEAYFDAFFGVLLAGGVPVPVYPPVRLSQIEDHMRRQSAILNNAGASLLVTVPEGLALGRLTRALVPSLRRVLSAAELHAHARDLQQPGIDAEDIALLQYTSGSTGEPKGVILSHANLLANIRAASQAVAASSRDVFVSWLPLYHDMGLIGACLATLYNGVQLVLMSPLGFLTRPQRWLWAMHRYRGTLSAAPNFAYELCLSRIDEADCEGLDLGSWRVALNGAEAISPVTLEGFCRRFAVHGFRAATMYPVYGLAECSVALAFPRLGEAPRIDTVQREALMRGGRALPAARDDPAALRFVGCGQALAQHEIRVVSPAGVELGDREQGRIEFRGPSATRGYFRNPDATRQLFHGDWLESGDLGYVADGSLFLTGRRKDIVIRGGRNIYSEEIEHAVGAINGVRRGRVAVFGSADAATGTERLIVVAEHHNDAAAPAAQLAAEINRICTELVGSPPDQALLVRPGTILKTSSGKLRRAACRDLFERGQLGQRAPGAWRQLWHLARVATPAVVDRLRRDLGVGIYSGYVWSMFFAMRALLWAGLILWPGRRGRWRLVHGAARAVLGLAGVPFTIHHPERLRRAGSPCVIVANHTSHLDPLLIAALMPRPLRFVAMRELAAQPWMRRFYERVGVEFVERSDFSASVRDARAASACLRAGNSLMFFPEGRLSVIPQLQAFRMGAFVAAVQAGVPVVPVALLGADAVMKGERRWLRRAPIEVQVGEPITPAAGAGDEWQAATRLRDSVHAFIATQLALWRTRAELRDKT